MKSEIRLIEKIEIPVENNTFKSDSMDSWLPTTGSTWVHSEFTNSARKRIIGSETSIEDLVLKQNIPYDYDVISATPFENSKALRVDYKVFGIINETTEFTIVLGGVSGDTRTENGDYYDIFYIGIDSGITTTTTTLAPTTTTTTTEGTTTTTTSTEAPTTTTTTTIISAFDTYGPGDNPINVCEQNENIVLYTNGSGLSPAIGDYIWGNADKSALPAQGWYGVSDNTGFYAIQIKTNVYESEVKDKTYC